MHCAKCKSSTVTVHFELHLFVQQHWGQLLSQTVAEIVHVQLNCGFVGGYTAWTVADCSKLDQHPMERP